jgi:hypothetical protein
LSACRFDLAVVGVDDFVVPGTPSVEELCERLAQRDGLIDALRVELGAARVRIAELEARLGQSSRNSSRPPSSDGLAVEASDLRKCAVPLSQSNP